MKVPRVYGDLGDQKQTGDLWLHSITCGVSCKEAQDSLVSNSVHGQSAHSEGLLLSEKLEHGWEVFLWVALRAHHPVDLMGLTAQEDGALGAGGRVLC